MSTERQEAKAEVAAAKARAKAMRPWYKKKRFIIPLAFVALIVIAGIAGSGSDDANVTADNAGDAAKEAGAEVRNNFSSNDENPPEADVEITACERDELEHIQAALKITNHSSKASNYTIEVAFEDPSGGEQIETGNAFVSGLEPNQSANEEAVTFTEHQGDFKCRITEVERFAS